MLQKPTNIIHINALLSVSTIESLKLYGTKEIPGHNSNPTIIGWAKELRLINLYVNDDEPWCSLANGIIATRAGKEVPMQGYDLLRALKWVRFGLDCKTPCLGDTMIFKRTGGGHVGLYIGEDTHAYHILGGNQGNEYKIARIEKDRLFACRRPFFKTGQPVNIRVIELADTGELSTDEK